MRVFISHKSEDVELAKHYAEELKKLGFDYYLDEYDIHIKNSSDRGSLINNEIYAMKIINLNISNCY